MALFAESDRPLVHAVSQLVYCNPFTPGRVTLERQALGDQYDPRGGSWNLTPDGPDRLINLHRIIERNTALLTAAHARLESGKVSASESDLSLYQDMAMFALFHRFREGFDRAITQGLESRKAVKFGSLYESFTEAASSWLLVGGQSLEPMDELPHLFACYFQVRRAFRHIFDHIIGQSAPTAQLRGAVWESIFTHDLNRYRRWMHRNMADYTTLVLGPSGTGKELVARAVGLSRYIPFEPAKQRFSEDFAGVFVPLNLSAMSPTLIESELFGHRRGAFTGAVEDRVGWLEACPPLGAVFLDEIGELDKAIQIKLLRVLQSRIFNRLGETQDRPFKGKIIAATNQDLARQMQQGEFRQDLYYRLCSDVIQMPSLRQRLADCPQELTLLIEHMIWRIVGDPDAALAAEVQAAVMRDVGADYGWPGNVRELEQSVRNILIRRRYQPLQQAPSDDEFEMLATAMRGGRLTADQLVAGYCRLMYKQTGSYEKTGRMLGLDRRTVKAKCDPGS